MSSSREFILKNSTWTNYPLWKYIKKEIPHYTKVLIIKELRLKNILVNQTPSYFQYKLKLGDLITIKAFKEENSSNKTKARKIKKVCSLTPKERLSLKNQIIYENQHLFIVNKQAGQFIQPNSLSITPSLEEKIQAFFSEQWCTQKCQNNHSREALQQYPPRFVHRLDRAVSGLVIGAKTAYAHSLLSLALKEGQIEKKYRALVYGSFTQKYLKLENWILSEQKRVKVLKKEEKNSKKSITEIKLLRNCKKYSYLELNLLTGRKNQLRAQLSELSFPILGERKYLTNKLKEQIKTLNLSVNVFNQKRIALLSLKVSFPPHLIKSLSIPQVSFSLPNSSNFLLDFLDKAK